MQQRRNITTAAQHLALRHDQSIVPVSDRVFPLWLRCSEHVALQGSLPLGFRPSVGDRTHSARQAADISSLFQLVSNQKQKMSQSPRVNPVEKPGFHSAAIKTTEQAGKALSSVLASDNFSFKYPHLKHVRVASLIHSCATAGQLNLASHILDLYSKHESDLSILPYEKMVVEYCCVNQLEEALTVFEKSKQLSLPVTPTIVASLIKGCKTLDSLPTALRLFETLLKLSFSEPMTSRPIPTYLYNHVLALCLASPSTGAYSETSKKILNLLFKYSHPSSETFVILLQHAHSIESIDEIILNLEDITRKDRSGNRVSNAQKIWASEQIQLNILQSIVRTLALAPRNSQLETCLDYTQRISHHARVSVAATVFLSNLHLINKDVSGAFRVLNDCVARSEQESLRNPRMWLRTTLNNNNNDLKKWNCLTRFVSRNLLDKMMDSRRVEFTRQDLWRAMQVYMRVLEIESDRNSVKRLLSLHDDGVSLEKRDELEVGGTNGVFANSAISNVFCKFLILLGNQGDAGALSLIYKALLEKSHSGSRNLALSNLSQTQWDILLNKIQLQDPKVTASFIIAATLLNRKSVEVRENMLSSEVLRRYLHSSTEKREAVNRLVASVLKILRRCKRGDREARIRVCKAVVEGFKGNFMERESSDLESLMKELETVVNKK